MIEDHQVDQVATDGPAEDANHAEVGVLERPRSGGAGVIDENRDVDVAFRTRRAPDPAPEQPGEPDGRFHAQPAREVVADAADRVVAHPFKIGHPVSNVPDTDAERTFGVPAPAGPQ